MSQGTAQIDLYPHNGGWCYRVEYYGKTVESGTVWLDKEAARTQAELTARELANAQSMSVRYDYEVPD